MKQSMMGKALVILLGMVLVLPASFAGSERLIMRMTPERMEQDNLIHVRFVDAKGNSIESDKLMNMVIRESDCTTGRQYAIPEDFKVGYNPGPKLVGIYLPPQNWVDKKICFAVPQVGQVESTLAVEESGRSLLLTLSE